MSIQHLQNVEHTRVAALTKLVLMALAYLADDGACSPRTGRLCVITNLSVYVLQREISNLYAANQIDCRRRPDGAAVYTIKPDAVLIA